MQNEGGGSTEDAQPRPGEGEAQATPTEFAPGGSQPATQPTQSEGAPGSQHPPPNEGPSSAGVAPKSWQKKHKTVTTRAEILRARSTREKRINKKYVD